MILSTNHLDYVLVLRPDWPILSVLIQKVCKEIKAVFIFFTVFIRLIWEIKETHPDKTARAQTPFLSNPISSAKFLKINKADYERLLGRPHYLDSGLSLRDTRKGEAAILIKPPLPLGTPPYPRRGVIEC